MEIGLYIYKIESDIATDMAPGSTSTSKLFNINDPEFVSGDITIRIKEEKTDHFVIESEYEDLVDKVASYPFYLTIITIALLGFK